MRFGINTFLFESPFTNRSAPLLEQFRKWGFDAVELAIENLSDIDPLHIKRELDRLGLACCSVCAAMGPDRDLRGDAQQQETSLTYLVGLLDLMVELDCPKLIGPVYSAVGRADAHTDEERAEQWKLVVGHLRTLSEAAEAKGRQVCLEPLNRFETDMINTCQQGLRMLADVDRPALTLHLDTFHMNIEEKSLPAAIKAAGAKLNHLHACGNDRGTPGNDHIDWPGIAAALRSVNYDGDVVIESFTTDVKVIARAAAIWRTIEPSRDDIAVKGLEFLRKTLAT
jgi:D-psicose/D-tagatose/L-ribulose 3-epimerase